VDYAFFLFMTLFPEEQAKAQAEIDAVIGHNRLPTLDDRDQLPYVCALVDEVLRFGFVSPQVARLCRVDDLYGEYLLPKGSFVIQNAWYVNELFSKLVSLRISAGRCRAILARTKLHTNLILPGSLVTNPSKIHVRSCLVLGGAPVPVVSMRIIASLS
jgi:hypothetical protein